MKKINTLFYKIDKEISNNPKFAEYFHTIFGCAAGKIGKNSKIFLGY